MSDTKKKIMFQKELKTELRSTRFVASVIICNVVLFICIAYFLNSVFTKTGAGYSTDYKLILGMYNVLLIIEYIIILGIVPFMATSAIGKEYEKGTIDLLLLTELKTSDILSIKLMRLFFSALLLIVTTLPLLCIVFSVGVVNVFHLLLYVVVVIGSVMCYSCIGFYVSVKTRKSTLSALITIVIELISTLGTYVLFGFIFKTIDGLSGLKVHLGDLLIANPLVGIFKVQSYMQGSSSTYKVLMDNIGVFGIVDVLWIPLTLILQLIVAFVMVNKAKHIMSKRHLK